MVRRFHLFHRFTALIFSSLLQCWQVCLTQGTQGLHRDPGPPYRNPPQGKLSQVPFCRKRTETRQLTKEIIILNESNLLAYVAGDLFVVFLVCGSYAAHRSQKAKQGRGKEGREKTSLFLYLLPRAPRKTRRSN